MNQISDLLVNEFIRLGVSTETDPYSGLSTEPGGGVGRVRVFDDYDSGHYDGQRALEALRGVTETSLAEVWEILKPFEIGG
jgi:hypothetical protein